MSATGAFLYCNQAFLSMFNLPSDIRGKHVTDFFLTAEQGVIDKDSKLEIFVEGDQIILKKHRPAGSCDFCGELVADMAQYEGYCICPACRAKIAAL